MWAWEEEKDGGGHCRHRHRGHGGHAAGDGLIPWDGLLWGC